MKTSAFKIFVLIVLFLCTARLNAATITSTAAGGLWTTGSTWSTGVAPATGDAVVIATTGTGVVTIAANLTQTAAGSVTVNTGATLTTTGGTITFGALTILSGGTVTMNRSLTVLGATSITGRINFGSTNTTSRSMTFNAAVTLNSGAVWNETTTRAAATFNFKDNLTNNATTFTAVTGTHTFSGAGKTISGTITTSIPRVSVSGTYTNSNTLSVTTSLSGGGGLTNGAAGLLNIGGTSTITSLTASAASNIVNYTGISQSVKGATYYNLTLSGSGTKIISGVTVTNIFSMEGTAAPDVAPTYGGAATLQYNTATARTAGPEWISPFAATGGVIIANTGVITMNANKTFNAGVPLTINSGSSLNTKAANNYSLTLGGNFTNNGTFTANASPITIASNVNQNISGFTTTGLVSMTKTGGTATLTGNVSGAGFTMNGSGGTLDLGTGLTHTFTGTWTRTNGTLLGGSSTLRIGGAVSGTGGTFTSNTSTVDYYAAGPQTMAVLTYNNLTLSGSGSKTFPAGTTTINGILSIEGTATTVVTGTLTYGGSATLIYKGSSAQTTGNEFPASWTGSGGVKIENASGVTLNAVRDINATPLAIGSMVANSVFNDGGKQLTATGTLNFVSGTFKLGLAAAATTFPAFGTRNISDGTTVEYAATATQAIKGIAYSNLTISGTGANSKVADANATVNGILNLNSANASASQGCLDMSTFTLTMGASATTTGTGDVTGIVTRNSFLVNTAYTFGNQFTTLTLSAGGTLPTSLSVKIILSTTHAFKTNAIHRYYDIAQTGGSAATSVSLALHYLDTELNGTTEANLNLFNGLVDPMNDASRSSFNSTFNWVGVSNLPITNIAPSTGFPSRYWTLGTSTITGTTWTGAISTDWTDGGNWSAGVPGSGAAVIIPDVGANNYPTLPASTTIGSISIQTNGVLNGGTVTALTISGGAGAWDNLGTFNPGTSTITFTNAAATMADPTNFYNVDVATGAILSLEAGNVMRIAGALTLTGTGKLNAATSNNIVEYNGASQTVVFPNGSTTGYYNLILSGSGTKTMPATTMAVYGNLTMSGTASATAAAALSVTGNVTLGSGTTFGASTFTHTVSGNWTNNGATFTQGTSTIHFNSTSAAQAINGTAASQTFNAIQLTKTAQTLSIGGSTTTLILNAGLTVTSGVFDAGTATSINVAGNWANSGTFTAGNSTVTLNGASAQSVSGTNTFNNLTVNNAAGVTASANQTVNGVLNLQSANASATQGALEMGSNTLSMGATATTTGAGDVTGIVTRSTFVMNTPYSFGSQYTTINFSKGPLPVTLSFKIILTSSEPAFMTTTTGIFRYYDIIQTGGDAAAKVFLNLHYLSGELQGALESNLDLFYHNVSPSSIRDLGRSNRSLTNKWVGLSNVQLTFLAGTAFGQKFWTLGTNNTHDNKIWVGGAAGALNDWTLLQNWNGGLPNDTAYIIIPNVNDDPTLPKDTTTTIGAISLQSGGVLNSTGTDTLVITAGSGAWENLGTFNEGNSIVIFRNAAATFADVTNFFNVTIADGARLTLGTNSYFGVSGTLSQSTTGVLDAGLTHNTVDYSGDAQTVIFANGSVPGYHNLILSGTGAKTMPSSPLLVGGSFTLNDAVSAVAAHDITVTDSISITASATLNASSHIISIGGNWIRTGTFTAGTGTVNFTGATAQTITGTNTFNNLTISGAGGVTALADQTVNGILNLANSNPSATKGLLEMTISYVNYPGTTISNYLNSYLLNMGTTATTIGTGDVTGTVKRSTIAANTSYTFGNQFTTIALTTGNLPSAIAVSITIGASPSGNPDAVARTYEIVPTVASPSTFTSTSTVTANFHYLDSELTSTISPYHLNTEASTVTMDYDIGGGYSTPDEHGRSNYDFSNNFIGLSNIPLAYFIQVPSTHAWRTLFQMRDFITGYYTWNGSSSTTWGTSTNWSPTGVPSDLSNIIIPDAGTTNNDPALPAGTTTIRTLSIENGGILTMGSNTLIIKNTLSGGWEDQNPVGNNPGTSTVIFSQPGTTISGNARFYDVEIGTGADITNQAGSNMSITHAITKTGTWHADVYNNTVDYDGSAQTVVTPDGTGAYYNLTLSGNGVKTIPATPHILGNFTLGGTASATAGGAFTVGGNVTLGSGTTFVAGAYTHAVAGNWTNNGGTFTNTNSTINFNSTSVAQEIGGTDASQTFNIITVNKSGQSLSIGGSTTSLTVKDLTITSGTLDAGTVSNINVSGAWTNNGTFTPGSSTVTLNGSASQTLGGTSTFYNLTVSNVAGVVAGNNQTVNGVLHLPSANPSATAGSLNMSSYILDMGAVATTTGTGDVSGIVRRQTITANTDYTFGNTYTALNLATGGVLPSLISVKIVLTTDHTLFKANAIHRYYDIIRTGGDAATFVTLKLHYLNSELNGNAEGGTLDLFDGKLTMTDDGNSAFSTTNDWSGVSGFDLTYVASTSFDSKYWTLGTSVAVPFTWLGASTDWTSNTNWVGNNVPGASDHVTIPNASTTTNDPTLPATTSIGSITINSGGIVNGGTGTTLTVMSGAGAWDNLGTFNPGTSTVIFSNAAPTMTGTTDFYNITISDGSTMTLGAGNIMRISGLLSLSSSGVLNAATNANTVQYNGADQTILDPKGTPAGYRDLILSGTGTKTVASGSLITLGGYVSIENGTILSIEAGGKVTSNGTLANSAGTAGLIIKSAAASSGSLILNNTGVAATVERYMTKGVWHMVTVPVSGQNIGDFVSDPANSIGYNSTTLVYGMMPYSPTANDWGAFFTSSTATNFNIGEGYMVRRKTSGADGIITTTGTAQSGTVTKTGLTAAKWNCIGNPYTSSIGVATGSTTTEKFLDKNAANFETNFGAIYVWDEQAGYTGPAQRSDYKAISNNGYLPELSKNYIQTGQGFLVRMGAGKNSMSFTAAMQSHQVTESFVKKSATSWPGFDLIASSATLSINTIVTFDDAMTTGLDATYDAGVLKGNANLSLYTRLVEDNGTGFSIQCLPLAGIDTFIIPVGIDYPSGGDITFTAKTGLIAPGSKVILEDRLLGTFTDLVLNPAGYIVNLAAGTAGTGRFYLHTGTGKATNIANSIDPLQVYASGKRIYVNGEIPVRSIVSLYSTQGVLVKNYSADGGLNSRFDATNLPDGVYILCISNKQIKRSYKLFLGYGL